MTLTRNSLLFFDATCLIAAAGSPTGGSGFLVSVCQAGFLKACSSPSVLVEAERNITAKLPPVALATYHLQLAATPIILVSTPPRLVVCTQSRVAEQTFSAASTPPPISIATIAPNPVICSRARWWPGSVGSEGCRTRLTAG